MGCKSLQLACLALFALFHVNAVAKEIRLAVGLALPPYYLAQTESGLELEIIAAALAVKGHSLTPVFVPFARVIPSLATGLADAAAPTNEDSKYQNGFYSESHISYKNVAVSMVNKGIEIKDLSQLADYSIVAFQNASQYLPAQYQQAVANNMRYSEKSRQDLQINMLSAGRAEVIVLDLNIFKYYAKEQNVDTSAMKIHRLFDRVDYKVLFNEAQLRDDFNLGLTEIRNNGLYQQILDRYLLSATIEPDSASQAN
ncbi:substrate-binding periplasmic protein [Motilimonas eburnea]|uniref:substrate-binding periplasmic protein n=1 Tax=Motilimonas eburnea TaxID=1737488 RepID=UPI001E34F90D|nr:transporter substrate-binding domain-containing protein [Motilimonas eburnea]MCE2570525.1 transporter substrate-binding domain-containing protein [Motilimonas eburnea]